MSYETLFLKNHTQNVVVKLVPDPSLKKENWAYLWINSLKFCTVCIYCIQSWRLSKYNETKLQTACLYLILSFFFLKKKWSSCLVFCIIFEEKDFPWYTLINCPSFIVWLLLFCEILGNVYCKCFLTRLWRHEFWS